MSKQHASPLEPKRLYLSATNKKLAGVCGGIGEFFNVDPTLIRLAWLIVSIPTGIFPGLLAYIVAAIVIPSQENSQ